MNVYVFSSKNITNIWAGYGAGLWAVADSADTSVKKGRITKAEKMKVGSLGILYCEPWKAFTVPFVVSAPPDKTRSEDEVWEGSWVLPFSFCALGSPRKKLSGAAIRNLDGAKSVGITNYGHYLRVRGDFAFQPSPIAERDWQSILGALV